MENGNTMVSTRQSTLNRNFSGGGFARVVALVATLGLAVACGDSTEKESTYIERGKALYEEGNHVKARLEFKNALQINPKGIDARYYTALIDEREGQWQKAFANFKLVAEQQPDHLQAQLKVGQFYLAAKQMDKAEEQGEIVKKLSPEDPGVIVFLATLDLRNDKLEEAKSGAEAALAKAPDNVAGRILLVRALQRLGKIDDAISEIDILLKSEPDSAAFLLMKAGMLQEKGNLDEVEAIYRRLVEIEPTNFSYRAALANFYARQNRLDESETVLRAAIADGTGGSKAKFALIDLLLKTKGREATEAELKTFIETNPDEHDYVLKLAEIYANNGDLDLAINVLRDRVEKFSTKADAAMDPSGFPVRVALSRLLLIKGDAESAESQIAKILELDAKNEDAMLMRASIALQKGDVDRAISDLRTILRENAESIPALRLLTQAQLVNREVDLAMDTLKRIVQLEPEDLGARQQLASLHAERGNREAALKLLDEVLEKQPNAASSLQAKASILISEENWDGAMETIAKLRDLPDQKPSAYTLEGALKLARGDYKEAHQAFEAARELAPKAPEPLTGSIQALLLQDKIGDAETQLREIIAEDESNAVAHNLLGEVLLRAKNNEQAVESFKSAIALTKTWSVPYRNLGRFYVSTNQPAEAIAVFKAGLDLLPGNVELLLGLAESQERSGDIDNAIATYESILAKDNTIDVAANNLAALIADHRYEDKDSLKRALDLAGRFENSTGPLFVDTLGWLQYRSGDLRQARVNIERAIALGSDDPQLHYHHGMILFGLGETELARKALEKAVVEGADYQGIDEARQTLGRL